MTARTRGRTDGHDRLWPAYVAFNRALWRAALRHWRGLAAFVAAPAALALGLWVLSIGWPFVFEDYVHDQAKLFYAKYLRRGVHYRFEEVNPAYRQIDVSGLIRIHSLADAEARRAEAIRVIWGKEGFPFEALPQKVEIGITDEYLSSLPEVASIDALDIVMEKGQLSRAYLIHARHPNGRLVVYHQGHRGQFFRVGRYAIAQLVAHGYDVLGFNMALYSGPNQIEVPGFGKIWVSRHDDFAYFDRPMAVFFEPLAEGLNYALKQHSYDDVAAIGFSGGAWTITVYAAIDTRIRKSYPVSGTYPNYLRRYPWNTWERPREYGQYMERYPPLYAATNYLELYILGGLGAGRQQMQILSKYDACCYGGMGWTTYVDVVRRRLAEIGPGAFRVVLDTSHADHKLSRWALSQILADLAL